MSSPVAAATAVVLDLPENYPEALGVIAHIVCARLIKNGMLDQKAKALAFDITESIRADVGGFNLYIPRGVKYELSVRDEQIYREFNGQNLQALAHQYKLSEMQMRTIVERGRARDQAQRQGALALGESS